MANTLVIYSEGYKVDFDQHVFPVEKYHLVYSRLCQDGLINKESLVEPCFAHKESLLLVHTENYLRDLFSLKLTERTFRSEIPLTQGIVDFFLLTTGGTILACRRALEAQGIAINLAGGYHHAYPERAEGFCYVNDIAVAVRSVQAQSAGLKVMIVDCDLHQGNGTAYIFKGDPHVFTFSIHQEDLYPVPKEKSSIDVGLKGGTSGKEYLEKLKIYLPSAIQAFKPDLIVYDAGADPYIKDQLGNLRLTKKDLKERDLYVLTLVRHSNIPVAIVLGGGYALGTEDVVDIHIGTVKTALVSP